jgi:hypothetical protein
MQNAKYEQVRKERKEKCRSQEKTSTKSFDSVEVFCVTDNRNCFVKTEIVLFMKRRLF